MAVCHQLTISVYLQRRVRQIALEVENWYTQNWQKGCSEVQWLTIDNQETSEVLENELQNMEKSHVK